MKGLEGWITCDKRMKNDERPVRRFFGNLYRNRPEFLVIWGIDD